MASVCGHLESGLMVREEAHSAELCFSLCFLIDLFFLEKELALVSQKSKGFYNLPTTKADPGLSSL